MIASNRLTIIHKKGAVHATNTALVPVHSSGFKIAVRTHVQSTFNVFLRRKV